MAANPEFLFRDDEFGGGPPPPYIVIQRDVVERRADGLWRRPYRRCVVGQEPEIIDGEWEPCESNQQQQEV